MIKPGEIQSIAGKEGVRDTQIEKDYIISWIINAIANNTFLKKNLIFKGGTVLKKVYFPDYRFSEDLDYTYRGREINFDGIKSAFRELIDWVYEESRIPLSFQNETKYDTGNYNFYLSYTGPLGGLGANKDIKVDISPNELIYYPPKEKQIIKAYSDLVQENRIYCYALGEIIAEKMRSIMQRTAPRDVYDLWYLFEIEEENIEDHIFAFQHKANHKGLNPNSLITVLELKEKTYEKHWENHLRDQLTEIPYFKDVWRELGKHWRKFQKFIQ